MDYAAVIFDLGGVVMGSPLLAIARFEKQMKLSENSISRTILAAGTHGAWARLERGELALPSFYPAFDAELTAAGLSVSSTALMAAIEASLTVRPNMINAIRTLKERGFKTAALTNNWKIKDSLSMNRLKPEFDVFIESYRVGMRKPEPAIYERVCRDLDIDPQQAIFLDDIGANLKPAKALGMTAVKVTEPKAALIALSTLLGIAFKV
jgi:putative hydrolase of the HAD superfamily